MTLIDIAPYLGFVRYHRSIDRWSVAPSPDGPTRKLTNSRMRMHVQRVLRARRVQGTAEEIRANALALVKEMRGP